MIIRAVKSFSGARFSMFAGELREVEPTDLVKRLIEIGYLEKVEAAEAVPEKGVANETKRSKPKRR